MNSLCRLMLLMNRLYIVVWLGLSLLCCSFGRLCSMMLCVVFCVLIVVICWVMRLW